jgi:hypothetical protein
MPRPSVHDNFVYAYAVLIDRRQLILHTEYRDTEPNELTDVIFLDVIAHHFEHVGDGAILLDVEEVEPEWVVRQEAEVFARGKNYGWPLPDYKDPADLVRRLKDQGLRGYVISSSFGLNGFVLAREVRYVKRATGRAFE